MLWSKQYFLFDLDLWLAEHGTDGIQGLEKRGFSRNREWYHMINDDMISMPDKWEYPWYAAWDLAFHMLAAGDGRPRFCQGSALVDAERTLHPSQRAAAGLRVELRRRQSAGARVGRRCVYDMEKAAPGRAT